MGKPYSGEHARECPDDDPEREDQPVDACGTGVADDHDRYGDREEDPDRARQRIEAHRVGRRWPVAGGLAALPLLVVGQRSSEIVAWKVLPRARMWSVRGRFV